MPLKPTRPHRRYRLTPQQARAATFTTVGLYSRRRIQSGRLSILVKLKRPAKRCLDVFRRKLDAPTLILDSRMALKRSCEGMRVFRSGNSLSQFRFFLPNLAMATKSSAPQITAQMAMATMLINVYVTSFRRGITQVHNMKRLLPPP